MSTNKNIAGFIGGFAILLLSACGGGGGGGSSSSPDPVTNTNSAPTISGTPSQTALAGATYQFQPTTQDADGDSLNFSATNLPAWLNLDASTGLLSGIPTDTTNTRYQNITLTVSDGKASTNLPAFEIAVTPTRAMTFSGIATDSPLVNARVVFTIDGIDYQTTTDSQGQYNLQALLPLIESPSGQPLVVHVYGTGNQSGAHLVGVLPGYDQLLALDISTVNLTQLPELRITQVSTARYLMALHLNDGVLPTSYEHLNTLYGLLDIEQLERVQSAIKLLVDNVNYDLGDQDLVTLLSGHDNGPEAAFKQWLASQSLLDGNGDYVQQVIDDLNDALAATQADPAQNLALTLDEVQGDLWIYTPSHPDLPPSGGYFLRLANNGAAKVSAFTSELTQAPNDLSDASWTLADGILYITGNGDTQVSFKRLYQTSSIASEFAADQGIYPDFAQHLIDNHWNQFSYFTIDQRLISSRVEIKARDAQGIWVKRVSTYDYYLNAEHAALYSWPSQAVSEPFTDTRLYRILNTSTAQAKNWGTEMSNQSWVLPFDGELVADVNGGTQAAVYSEYFLFNSDGTAFARYQNKTFSWVMSGNILTLTDAEASRQYEVLWQRGQLNSVKLTANHNDQSVILCVGYAVRDLNEDAAFQAVSLSERPDYWQTGITLNDIKLLNADLSISTEGFFGWSFLDGGDIQTGALEYDKNNCIDTSKDCIAQNLVNPTWAIENGVLTHTLDTVQGYQKRPWEVMRHNTDYTIILEYFDRYEDGAEFNYFRIPPRLNPVFRSSYPADLWANTPQ